MAVELEAKIPLAAHEAVRARLNRLGAQPGETVIEHNCVYDTTHLPAPATGVLLRLRMFAGRTSGRLTVKHRPAAAQFKSVLEEESEVTDAAAVARALSALGFKPRWRYEKKRETWHYRGCEVALDELPELGRFVEVEGSDAAAIGAVLADLELNPDDHLPDNYLRLFQHRCESRGEPLRPLLFAPSALSLAE